MKSFAFLFAVMLCAPMIACLSEDDPTTSSVEQGLKRVDCQDRVTNFLCKECGNRGTTTCCPPDDDCYVYCEEWEYDRQGNRSCPPTFP